MSNLQRTTIIAEVGVNHDGSVERALELVDAASDAGADIVKFQTFDPVELVQRDAPKAQYQESRDWEEESQFEMLTRLTLSDEELERVADHCKIRQIEFLSTAFGTRELQRLVELGIQRIKIPSGEITNKRFLQFAGSLSLPVILSTGMSSMEEVDDACAVLHQAEVSDLTVLHCTSAYPAPFEDLNLRCLGTYQSRLGVKVGYSDHSQGVEASIAAVAMGSSMIEKHITLDVNAAGPDHLASTEPDEFRRMVQMIRNIEIALGSDEKFVTPSERDVRAVARRSLVAQVDIEAGTIVEEWMLRSIRPGSGVSPMRIDDVVGVKAPRAWRAGELID